MLTITPPLCFDVFGLTQQELEPMIYHTPGGHANYYTTTVFLCLWFVQQRLEPMIYHTPGGHANYYTTTVF